VEYVIASSRNWNESMVTRISEITGKKFHYISNKNEFTADRLAMINPRYIFFPHWSHIVPAKISENYECIIFHMTDLPFGRGGSPLQNLIARGIYETCISAFRCETELDAGPVYMKHPLSLYGTAEEIYLRAANIIEKMIIELVLNEPKPTRQQGEVVCFKRRKPHESDISGLKEIEQVYDFIRMLDADGYPRAFLETDHLRLEFTRSALKNGQVISDVIITKKG
jgi:methionyl-tRNA formyltransferase